ncbi:MAG: hypothetical protein AMS22_01015 [Thiotrichales bacterium SG8_50]|nr:MAG: hypothetical protein AMS22_01015 [Thiotrichales bacterium SG8_50]
MSEFAQLVYESIRRANASGQAGSLAHLYLYSLNRLSMPEAELALDQIKRYVLPQMAVEDLSGASAGPSAVYQPDAAIRSYERYAAAHDISAELDERVLLWLLDGDFDDGTQTECRNTCLTYGVTPALLVRPQQQQEPDFGFGEQVNEQWASRHDGYDLVGRDETLERHLGLLSILIRQGEHYLLEGPPGVGKTVFARELVRRAYTRWQASADPGLANVRFLICSPKDFLGTDEENRARLEALFSYLRRNVHVVPVFDGFEFFTNPALNTYTHFRSLFGGVLSSRGRTYMLISRTANSSGADLVKRIKATALDPLPQGATLQVVKQRLSRLRVSESQQLCFDTSEDEFCNTLLQIAEERYPGRFFPEIAIHLAESAVGRSVHRTLYAKEPPLWTVSITDLWQHVAEEQGIGTEVLGKNPREFYAGVRAKLRQEVVGQDHAVEIVCRWLAAQAKRPPSRVPRGRFLFVGPPGVGKTQLGRTLARALGFGEEAFFRFNMSEYGTDAARTRFMGADPGYVGFKSTRTIYDMVRSRPSCVVLLDEIDRAHSSIQDILLSILEGEGKDAEGASVYFSQVIFIMTTNLGQDAVAAMYDDALSKSVPRRGLADGLTDARLRALLLEGVQDDAEADMKQYLDEQIRTAKDRFAHFGKGESGTSESGRLEAIVSFVQMREMQQRLERARRNSSFDRAFLDRVDAIVPFFPIKEGALLRKILELQLKTAGWDDCPELAKMWILQEAMREKESIRPLQRLIQHYWSILEQDERQATEGPVNGQRGTASEQ